MLNFFISNFNFINLFVWIIFFAVVVVRVVRPKLVKSISYNWLISIAIGLYFLRGILGTWGQYVVWNGFPVGKMLINAPLPKAIPFDPLPAFMRPLFEHAHGFFAFYTFYTFFLSTIVMLLVVGVLILIFKIYAHYRTVVLHKDDLQIVVLALLISGAGLAGWAGLVLLVPLSLVFAVVLVLLSMKFAERSRIRISTAFLIATPVALVFAIPLLTLLSLWPLLKL